MLLAAPIHTANLRNHFLRTVYVLLKIILNLDFPANQQIPLTYRADSANQDEVATMLLG